MLKRERLRSAWRPSPSARTHSRLAAWNEDGDAGPISRTHHRVSQDRAAGRRISAVRLCNLKHGDLQAEKEAAGTAAVLCFAASFAPDAIPDELFRQPLDRGAALQPTIPNDALVLDLKSAFADNVRLDEALGALDRLQLLTFAAASRTYSIHRLVQLAARDMVAGIGLAWRECVVAVAEAAFPHVEFATWPQCARLSPHAQAALDALPGDVVFLAAAHLANRCALYLWNRGEYGAAEPLYTRALAIRRKRSGRITPTSRKA